MGTDRASEKYFEEMLQQLSYIATHSSKTAEMLATGVVNNVLEVGTGTFDTTGQMAFSWNTTCGAIEVANHGVTPVFVSGSMASGAATPRMARVDPGSIRTINVASRNVTLYGTAGALVGFQALTRGGIIGNNFLAVDGGAP